MRFTRYKPLRITTESSTEPKKGKTDGWTGKNLDDLIAVGKMREEEKVWKFNELIEMRMERRKHAVKELIAKRAGTFQQKDDKM